MLNLLPQEEFVRLRRQYRMRVAALCLYFLFWIVLSALAFLLPSYVLSIIKQDEVKNEARNLKTSLAKNDFDSLSKLLNQTKSSVALLSPIQNIYAYKVSAELFGLIPKGIKIQSVNFTRLDEKSEPKIEIKGVSEDRDILQSFAEKIAATNPFTEVDQPPGNFIKRQNVNFVITVGFLP